MVENFFSPVSGTNISVGYACTGNVLIGLVGIRGKTCFGRQLYLENCARTLRDNSFPDTCTAAHQNKLLTSRVLLYMQYSNSCITVYNPYTLLVYKALLTEDIVR